MSEMAEVFPVVNQEIKKKETAKKCFSKADKRNRLMGA